MSPLLPKLLAGRRGLSRGAQEYRGAMWMMVALGAAGFALAIAAVRGRVAASLGTVGLAVGLGALALAAWFGLRVRARALADRERESSGALTVLLAAQLKDRDEATLLELVRKGGPAAQAAQLILDGRRERRQPA